MLFSEMYIMKGCFSSEQLTAINVYAILKSNPQDSASEEIKDELKAKFNAPLLEMGIYLACNLVQRYDANELSKLNSAIEEALESDEKFESKEIQAGINLIYLITAELSENFSYHHSARGAIDEELGILQSNLDQYMSEKHPEA